MNGETDKAVADWLVRATSDLAAARRLMSGDEPLYDSAVDHAQQAAEKALKAFLTNAAKPFPKTHELSLLLDLIVPIDPSMERFREHCLILSPYASEFRYPGGEFAPAASDATHALALAEEMVSTFHTLLDQRS